MHTNQQFCAECAQFKLSAVAYFELAHRALHGRAPDNIGSDYATYLTENKLPPYVEEYLAK